MSSRLFLCLCGAIFELLSAEKHPLLEVNPVGSTFNIQNFIPHKSQKTKAVSEMNRAKEFQRGTAGVLESNKKRRKVLFDETDILLGARCREFESPISDQVMIIRTTLSKWVMCSDLSFLLKIFYDTIKTG